MRRYKHDLLVVAYAVECYERRLIGNDQTDGLELGWGRPEAIVALVEKIGKAADGTEWTLQELDALGRRLTLARYLS